jgi:hypothetical protein
METLQIYLDDLKKLASYWAAIQRQLALLSPDSCILNS